MLRTRRTQHLIPDAEVIDVGPLVAACHHYGLVFSYSAVARGKCLYEFVARHDLDVGKPLEMYFWQCYPSAFADGLLRPYLRGIPQNARLLTLAQHLVQVALMDVQAVASQHFRLQGRTPFFTDWRQLGTVANEQQAAVAFVIDKTHQVVEQR